MPEEFVFDTCQRTDVGRKLRSESVFEYLNRSAEVPAGRVRDLIEAWYTAFPQDGKTDIRGRLRSGEAGAFDSGFHELCLHDLLSKLRLTAELHPSLAMSTKNPDFLVHGDAPGDFYLEAVAPTDVSDPGARQRAAVLLDGLDTRLENPNYWLSITVEQYSTQNGSPKRFRRFAEQALANLPAAPVTMGTGLAEQLEPRRFLYDEDGWIIELAGFPKTEMLRGKPGLGAIGMELSRFEDVVVHNRLRTALEKKAKKYGSLGLPYIIAVNTNDMFGSEDELLMALFGIGASPMRKGRIRGELEVTLAHDGLWIKADRPRNTQVSAVLLTRKISAGNLGSATGTLYLNPWASRPYGGALTGLPTAVFTTDGSQYETRPGRPLQQVLAIDDRWPGWPTEEDEDETPREEAPTG
jgi:hypothetical protein